MIIDKKTLDCYKNNIKTRRWIPWDEYLELKVGDKLELPYYEYGCDEPSGKDICTIKELTRGYSESIEHGNFCAEVTRKFFNGKKEHWHIGGTLSVNLDGVSCEGEEIPSDEVINKIINIVLAWTYDTEDIDNGDNPMAIEFIKKHWND